MLPTTNFDRNGEYSDVEMDSMEFFENTLKLGCNLRQEILRILGWSIKQIKLPAKNCSEKRFEKWKTD